MKLRHLVLVISAMVGLCMQANASTNYYLVGLRHVYLLDGWPDEYGSDRQAIEEEYSGALLEAQHQYEVDMSSIRKEESEDDNKIHQIDRDAVQQNLEQDIANAADKRDQGMSQIYLECDYIRDSHPEFQLDQDGPYEVMACDEDSDGDLANVCFYRPYPLDEDACPLGWSYGRVYSYITFVQRWRLYHRHWVAIGNPVFAPLYHNGVRVNILSPVRRYVIASRRNWVNGRPPAISAIDRQMLSQSRELQRQAGIRPASTHPGVRPAESVAPSDGVSHYSKSPSSSQSGSSNQSRNPQNGNRNPGGGSGPGTSRDHGGSPGSGQGSGGSPHSPPPHTEPPHTGNDDSKNGDKKKGG